MATGESRTFLLCLIENLIIDFVMSVGPKLIIASKGTQGKD
jgi:hypothetical protein